jgi:hypothetical protein
VDFSDPEAVHEADTSATATATAAALTLMLLILRRLPCRYLSYDTLVERREGCVLSHRSLSRFQPDSNLLSTGWSV